MDTALARQWVHAISVVMDEHQEHLTQLDSAIGDADHGANMHRGFTAAALAVAEFDAQTVGEIFVKTGNTLITSVGGASGPLYGSTFRAVGKALPYSHVDADQLLVALHSGLDAVQTLGAAVPGDKTMVDAVLPALTAFEKELRSGGDLASASVSAARAAEEGARDTGALQARKGRASYLGPRSIGHQDPGATSSALIFAALAEVTAPK